VIRNFCNGFRRLLPLALVLFVVAVALSFAVSCWIRSVFFFATLKTFYTARHIRSEWILAKNLRRIDPDADVVKRLEVQAVPEVLRELNKIKITEDYHNSVPFQLP
jgi:hypothetical protein